MAALAGVGAMAVFVVALLIPPGWGLAVFGVGVVTFVVVLLNNPAHWIRRLSGACIAAAVATAATPRIAGALDLGSLGVVIVELGADVWIALSFLAGGVALAVIAKKRQPTRALLSAEGAAKSLHGGVHASDRASLTAREITGGDKHMRDAYGDGSTVYNIGGGATFHQGASPAPPSPPSARQGLPAPLREFLAWQERQPSGLNLIGVGGGNIRLDLDEVYVPLRLTSRREDFDHRRRAEDDLSLAG